MRLSREMTRFHKFETILHLWVVLGPVALAEVLCYNKEKKKRGVSMLLGELRQYALPFDECRILNRQVQVGDCPVAAAAVTRRGSQVQLILLQYDPTWQERKEAAERLDWEDPQPAPRTHREELFQREAVEAALPVENLEAVSFGSASYPLSGGQTGEVEQDWEALLLLAALLRAGWDMGALADCPTEGMFLSRYDWREAFDAIPDTEGPLTLVPAQRNLSGLEAVDLTVPLGDCDPISLELPDGPAVYVTGASLHDPWKQLEETFSHPKILAQFTPEELAKRRADLENLWTERCPRGMAYPVVCYEAERDVSIQCYAKSWLDEPLPQPENGIQNGFCVMLWDRDAPLGPHGWPMKQAVLSDVPVPLESREAIQVGAVRWHRRESVAPLVLE